MRRLVLMPDATADPLWDDRTGAMVRLADLPISESLKHRLTEWRERWEVLNDAAIFEEAEDPAANAVHRREKAELWMALREELGPEFQVGVSTEPPAGKRRVHVIWEPGAQPELPAWFRKRSS